MPDALLIAIAALIAFSALCSLALGVYLSALDMWRQHHRKREEARRGGLIDLTPSRDRLGLTRRPRRGSHRSGS